MLSLLSDNARQEQMRKDGIVQAYRFTWKRAARELMKIYNNLLDMEPKHP
jgi:hypothetical protein